MAYVLFVLIFLVWKKFSVKQHPRRPEYLRVPRVDQILWRHDWLTKQIIKDFLLGHYFWLNSQENPITKALVNTGNPSDFGVYVFMGTEIVAQGFEEFVFWDCSVECLDKPTPREEWLKPHELEEFSLIFFGYVDFYLIFNSNVICLVFVFTDAFE